MKSIKLAAMVAFLALSVATGRPANREIYPAPTMAKTDLEAALKNASETHSASCSTLAATGAATARSSTSTSTMRRTSRCSKQTSCWCTSTSAAATWIRIADIASKYQIPLEKGVPAIAVLSDKGKLLYSQKTGEFEKMRHMESSSVTSFLMQWKPAKAGCSAVMMNC